MKLILQIITKLINYWQGKQSVKTIKADPIDRIQKAYAIYGYKWAPHKDLILLQNFDRAGDKYNDWLVFKDAGEWVRIRVTGEAGEFSGYDKGWRSRFQPGQYENLYKIGTMKAFGNLQILRMQYQIELYNLDTGKVHRGGGCNLHPRKSTGEKIGKTSKGCIVPFFREAFDDVMEWYYDSKQTHVNLTVLMQTDIPELLKIPVLEIQ